MNALPPTGTNVSCAPSLAVRRRRPPSSRAWYRRPSWVWYVPGGVAGDNRAHHRSDLGRAQNRADDLPVALPRELGRREGHQVVIELQELRRRRAAVQQQPRDIDMPPERRRSERAQLKGLIRDRDAPGRVDVRAAADEPLNDLEVALVRRETRGHRSGRERQRQARPQTARHENTKARKNPGMRGKNSIATKTAKPADEPFPGCLRARELRGERHGLVRAPGMVAWSD